MHLFTRDAAGRRSTCSQWLALLSAVILVLLPASAAGQGGRTLLPLIPNGEAEAYLRNLQVSGRAPLRIWSVRPFSPREAAAMIPADSAHPWAGRLGRPRGDGAGLLSAELRSVFNSGFPFGGNDGAVWTGKGATVAAQAGGYAQLGPLSLQLYPVVFWAQNADFELMATGMDGPQRFADPKRPNNIDLPQRFGDGSYARLDPGDSWIRLDAGPVVVGASTAPQAWGGGAQYPLILSQNAPGFAHLFVGTSTPANIGVGRLHLRMVYGDLRQSSYAAPDTIAGGRRFGSGTVIAFTPALAGGLEIGLASFVHASWPSGGPGLDYLVEPLRGLFFSGREQLADTAGVATVTSGNQIVSVFGRWVFPKSGLEVFGEFGREDRAFDVRNALVEPDHDAAYALGLRKVWQRSGSSWVVLRGEYVSTQISHLDLTDKRTVFYTHSMVRQGHTNRGQLLGAADSYGGAAGELAADAYHPRGRWTVSLQRTLRRDPADYALKPEGEPDVVTSAGVEAVRFLGPVDLTVGARGAWELNRDFAGDAFNVNLVLGLRTSAR